jgi:hypothetical protein
MFGMPRLTGYAARDVASIISGNALDPRPRIAELAGGAP